MSMPPSSSSTPWASPSVPAPGGVPPASVKDVFRAVLAGVLFTLAGLVLPMVPGLLFVGMLASTKGPSEGTGDYRLTAAVLGLVVIGGVVVGVLLARGRTPVRVPAAGAPLQGRAARRAGRPGRRGVLGPAFMYAMSFLTVALTLVTAGVGRRFWPGGAPPGQVMGMTPTGLGLLAAAVLVAVLATWLILRRRIQGPAGAGEPRWHVPSESR